MFAALQTLKGKNAIPRKKNAANPQKPEKKTQKPANPEILLF